MEFGKVINMIYAIFKKIYTYTQTYPYFVDKFKCFYNYFKGNSGYYCGLYFSPPDIKNRKLQLSDLMSIFFNCVI